MAVSDTRPFYLNLIKIRLPIQGFVSILHRVTGVLLFIAMPFSIYLLDISLRGEGGFQQALDWLDMPLVKLIGLVLAWSLLHHFFAGIRYLLIDFDIGVEKQSSRRFAWLVLVSEAVALVALIAWVCL